jgi:methylmalonyl-CoA/ethylmalonyl-CoA epimerase
MKDFIKKIDHIALIVEDLDTALEFWHDALGLDLSHVEDVPSEHAIVAFLPARESEVELVKPTNEDSGIARFLKKRGPGMHHICFEVYDIEETMLHLKSKGVRLINQTPEIGTGGKKIAFVHPESTNGVLVELYELTSNEMEIRLERARLLADRVLANSQQMAASAREFLRNLRDRQN